MLFEKFLHGTVKVITVLLIVKAVALIILYHVFNFHPTLPQRLYHLVAFSLVHARVVRSLG